ncbi:MAG TPA: hypothetical protein VF316_16470, partial [Polyangiaceae bacterium]
MFKRLLAASLCLALLAGTPSLTRAQGVPRQAPIERVYTLEETLRLLRNDPKLQSAEQDVIIADARVTEARLLFLPEVGLQASATKYDA